MQAAKHVAKIIVPSEPLMFREISANDYPCTPRHSPFIPIRIGCHKDVNVTVVVKENIKRENTRKYRDPATHADAIASCDAYRTIKRKTIEVATNSRKDFVFPLPCKESFPFFVFFFFFDKRPVYWRTTRRVDRYWDARDFLGCFTLDGRVRT